MIILFHNISRNLLNSTTNLLDNKLRYNLAIEEPFLGLAEYSTHLIKACLLRDEFNIIMVVNRSDIVAFKKCHQKMGINSGVEYISFDDLTFKKWRSFDAMLSYHQNHPHKLIRDIRSPTDIPRIVMTHTLTDKNVVFPTKNRWIHPMGHFNVYFATGSTAFKGSWEKYIKIHPSTLKTVKIFKVGRPRTDVLFGNIYDRKIILTDLGLDSDKKTILYSPTFQKEASLEQCGLKIIDIIRSMDVNLLIRPHFMSLALDNAGAHEHGHGGNDWRKILKQIENENNNIRFVEGDSNPFFVASDLLIGDVSGACYEFLLQDKPVVFIDTPKFFAEHGRGGISYWGRESGEIVSDLNKLADVVQYNLDNPDHKEIERHDLIQKLVYNHGNASKVAVDTITGLINGKIRFPKWGCRIIRIYLTVAYIFRLLRKVICS